MTHSNTYMSVERSRLQKAFALAHKAAEHYDVHDKERKYFRAIAWLIWLACGEEGTPIEGNPKFDRFMETIGPLAEEELSRSDKGTRR